jgi:hypothetical protein
MAFVAIKSDKMRIILHWLAVKKYLASVGRSDDCVAELARFQTMTAKYFFDIELAHKNYFPHSIFGFDETKQIHLLNYLTFHL